MNKVTPFLWYNGNLNDAITLYRSVFPNSTVVSTSPGPAGLMSATVEIEGQRLILFNGGPGPELSPAVSLFVSCETQEEIDRLWAQLTAGGGSESQCGWLVDPFGLSWQIIPSILPGLLGNADREKAGRALKAMLGMKKLDIAALQNA